MLEDKKIDKKIPVPLYYQLKMALLEEINSGAYNGGKAIPTEAEIEKMFDISRTTVRQAIAELVQEGYLYRVKSKGTFVSKPKVSFQLLSNIYDDSIRASGRKVEIKVLEKKIVEIPDDLSELLRDTTGTRAVYLERLRMADGVPICLVKSYLRGDLFSGLMDLDMEKVAIHDLMESKEETKVTRMLRTIEAINADQELEEKMSVDQGDAIQKLTSKRYNSSNEMMDISYGFYRGDMNKIEFEITNPPY